MKTNVPILLLGALATFAAISSASPAPAPTPAASAAVADAFDDAMTCTFDAQVVATMLPKASDIPDVFQMDRVPVMQDLAPGETKVLYRNNETERGVDGAAAIRWEVWEGPNQSGRHETLWAETRTCYRLKNGWDNAIETVQVYEGNYCVMYRLPGCRGEDLQLHSRGPVVVQLRNHKWQNCSFDNMISSYYCGWV